MIYIEKRAKGGNNENKILQNRRQCYLLLVDVIRCDEINIYVMLINL